MVAAHLYTRLAFVLLAIPLASGFQILSVLTASLQDAAVSRMNIPASPAPLEPGCYLRKPMGCPNHPEFNNTEWQHANAESTTQAKMNRTACEMDVKGEVSRWCGIEDIEVLFVPESPAKPKQAGQETQILTEPGCYLRKPLGCPNHPEFNNTEWQHANAESTTQAKMNRTACEMDVKGEVSRWCGSEDIEVLFVPESPTKPEKVGQETHILTEPGCYLRKPMGCPNHPEFNNTEWQHANAESTTQAKMNRTACEMDVKGEVSRWCGIENIEVLFVPEIPTKPKQAGQETQILTEPGCYLRKPLGCPNHPEFNNTEWQHANAESTTQAKTNRTACEMDVKWEVSRWCGSEAIEVLFVPERPTKPEQDGQVPHILTEPGCYLRKPMGCPNHPEFNNTDWQRANAESTTQAKMNRTACEMDVRGEVSRWCGIEKIEVLFVPASQGLQEQPREQNRTGDLSSTADNARSPDWNQNLGEVVVEEAEDEDDLGEEDDWPISEKSVSRRLVPLGRGSNESAELPTEPGCFLRKPQGCPDHPEFNNTEWQHANAEKTTQAKQNRTACEVDVKAEVSQWCGTEHIEVLFVRQKEPGCYVRTPWGCPNHPGFGSQDWKHDCYAEKYAFATFNRTECEVTRRQRVAQWCGAKDVETLFVIRSLEETADGWSTEGEMASVDIPTDPTPTEPGCFVRTPSGCPNHPIFHSSAWKHEEYGERFTEARLNRTMCEVDRQAHLAEWCGVKDVELLFVAPARPGCYVSTPSGCPNHPSFGSLVWKHEEFGESHTDAKVNRASCEIYRKAYVASWCGTEDIRMHFVPPDWESLLNADERFDRFSRTGALREPGCFIRTPSGCPKHPSFGSSLWQHARHGARATKANVNRTACEVDHRVHMATWCGTEDVDMLFVPPPEPGCYVRALSGCPQHPLFGFGKAWEHEEFGEAYTDARVNRTECEVARRASVANWCGSNDIEMLFIPAPAS